MCWTGCTPYVGHEAIRWTGGGCRGVSRCVRGPAASLGLDRSYTKPGTVYSPVKPLRGCPICELPELRHILQQLLWYYTVVVVVATQSQSADAHCQSHTG